MINCVKKYSFGFATEVIPIPPSNGTFILKSVNGVPGWVTQ